MHFIILLLFLLLTSCHYDGYQKDHTLRIVHIFGIGWIFEKSGTNKLRVLSIGSMQAAIATDTAQTNAPFTLQNSTNRQASHPPAF